MRTTLQLLGVLLVVMIPPQAVSQPENRRIQEINTGETNYDDRSVVAIEELFVNPAAFDKRHVRITGAIGDQDPRGYWLYLTDQAATIYIETPLQLTQLGGKTVTVRGTVNVQHGIPSIIAREVR